MSVNSSEFSLFPSVPCLFFHTAQATLKIIVVLPLCVFVLFLGFRMWRQQQAASHFQIFTHHLSVMELIWVGGTLCALHMMYFGGAVAFLGMILSLIAFYGEFLFHTLTCVERYIAVVHPITYLGLRNACGVRIRNISIALVWLLSLVLAALNQPTIGAQRAHMYAFIACCLLLTTFCSGSVLWVVMHPGPGDAGRRNKKPDLSKRKAFHTIALISSFLWFGFFGVFISYLTAELVPLGSSVQCFLTVAGYFSTLPNSLVLPLLYLHRAGKLSCCGCNAK